MTAADGSIFALRASDGTLLWHKKVPAFAVTTATPPLIDNHIIYINLGQSGGTVFALQASNGNVLCLQEYQSMLQQSRTAFFISDMTTIPSMYGREAPEIFSGTTAPLPISYGILKSSILLYIFAHSMARWMYCVSPMARTSGVIHFHRGSEIRKAF